MHAVSTNHVYLFKFSKFVLVKTGGKILVISAKKKCAGPEKRLGNEVPKHVRKRTFRERTCVTAHLGQNTKG